MAVQRDDSFRTKSSAFLVWLQQNGTTISPKIELADLRQRGAGRGVVATRDIEEDEEIFIVPRSSILTIQTSALPSSITDEINDPWLSLILAMVCEHQRGTQSAWKPYFDVLPAEFDTLMFWSPGELKQLEGSAVLQKIGRETADARFRDILLPTIRHHIDRFCISASTGDERLLGLCHSMGSTIMAYAFDLEKPYDDDAGDHANEEWEEDSDAGHILSKGMIPLADMVNADADRNNVKLFYEADTVVMKSIAPIAAGEELLNDYGPLPRADVLRRYGYVTGNYAKYDVVEIGLDLITISAVNDTASVKIREAGWTKRMTYLEEQGIVDTGYDVSHVDNEEGPFQEELCILLNTLTMSQPDFEKSKKKDKFPKSQLSKPSMQVLRNILNYRRAMYPACLPASGEVKMEDHAGSEVSDKRKKMAKQVIDGEKAVLQEAIHYLQSLLGESESKKRTAKEMEEQAAGVQKMQKVMMEEKAEA